MKIKATCIKCLHAFTINKGTRVTMSCPQCSGTIFVLDDDTTTTHMTADKIESKSIAAKKAPAKKAPVKKAIARTASG